MTFEAAIKHAKRITVLHCSGGLSVDIAISKKEANRLRRATGWIYSLDGQTLAIEPTDIHGTDCAGWVNCDPYCEECGKMNCTDYCENCELDSDEVTA